MPLAAVPDSGSEPRQVHLALVAGNTTPELL